MRSAALWVVLVLCLLAIPLGLYGILNTMVSQKYTPEMADWDAQVRQLQLVVGIAVIGASASAWALNRLRRARRP